MDGPKSICFPKHYGLLTYFTPFSSVSIANFEQVNISWEMTNICNYFLIYFRITRKSFLEIFCTTVLFSTIILVFNLHDTTKTLRNPVIVIPKTLQMHMANANNANFH